MKQLILFTIFSFFAFQLSAQTCEPDSSFIDAGVGVFPPPFQDTIPGSGIGQDACINEYYEFPFTFVVPTTFDFGGFPLTLVNISMDPEMAIQGLPEGMDYICSPPDCIYPGGSLGCALIFGTPTAANMAGDYNLTINLVITTVELGPIPFTFPDETLAPGTYTITLNEEGGCVSSTGEALSRMIQMQNSPNPFGGMTNIEITSEITDDFSMEVYDMLGKQVIQKEVTLVTGYNSIPFDGSHLPEGIYVYSLRKGTQILSNRMVISRK